MKGFVLQDGYWEPHDKQDDYWTSAPNAVPPQHDDQADPPEKIVQESPKDQEESVDDWQVKSSGIIRPIEVRISSRKRRGFKVIPDIEE